MKLQVYKLDPKAIIPTRYRPTDCGYDLYTLDGFQLNPGEMVIAKTGIAINIPKGYFGKICDRSSMAVKGFHVHGGQIDSGYSGDCSIIIQNTFAPPNSPALRPKSLYVQAGEKIAQLVILSVPECEIQEVNELWTSERSNKGFGSSGT